MYSLTARVFVWDFSKLRKYLLISCHLIAVVNGTWIAFNLPDRSSETKISMKPGEKSKSKTSSTVSRENPHPPQNSNRIQLQYIILHIHIIYGSYHIQYNTIIIYSRYIQITSNPIIYVLSIYIYISPQSDIYPYSLIGRSPQTPNPSPLSPFAGSKLRQLLTDAGAVSAPNADALATETPTPKASGKKPKAKAKASFAEASSNVTGLH